MTDRILFLVALLLPYVVQAQCPGFNVELTTQAEVDAFVATYPSCTEVRGSLRIGSTPAQPLTDITDVSALSFVTAVGGNLQIWRNPNLTTLDGLENVASAGSSLHLNDMNGLTDLNGLEGLSSIGSNLIIDNCLFLLSLDGLGGISTVPGRVYIANNQRLTSLQALQPLTSVGGDFEVRICRDLLSLEGLDSLASVGEDFTLVDNHLLTDVTALDHLLTIGGTLTLRNNFVLSACGVEGFCKHLNAPMAQSDITGNAAGCETPNNVLETCERDSSSVLREVLVDVHVFPNPVTSFLRIDAESSLRNLHVSVRDVRGALQPVTYGHGELDARRLPPGVYWLQLRSDEGSAVRKLVKR